MDDISVSPHAAMDGGIGRSDYIKYLCSVEFRPPVDSSWLPGRSLSQ